MKYVLAPNNVFQRFILPGEIIQFSDRCKTTAKRLTAEESADYGVSKLQLVSAPAYDPITQSRSEGDPLLVDGVWVQQWVVGALDAATAAVNLAAATKRHNDTVWQQIATLERDSLMPRALRDLIPATHPARAKVEALEAEITALKATLK